MPTITRILELAPVAAFLSANYVAKRTGLFGGVVDETNPKKIYNVYKILRHVYDKDPLYPGLQVRCDYLYELMKRWAFAAAAVVDGGGGGSVAPPTPPSSLLPEPLDFIVSGSSFISTGDTVASITNFIGYNLSFDRNGQPQYTTDPGDGTTYFSWNRVTGAFTLNNGAAQETERFRLTPIG